MRRLFVVGSAMDRPFPVFAISDFDEFAQFGCFGLAANHKKTLVIYDGGQVRRIWPFFKRREDTTREYLLAQLQAQTA